MEEEIKRQEGAEETTPQPITDPVGLLKMLCKGTLELFEPIKVPSGELTELEYDFMGLTSSELLNALDSVPTINTNPFAVTNVQAMAVFAATAAKCNKEVDAKDVKDRLSPVDTLKAVQMMKLFWNASSRAGRIGSSNG